MTRLLLIILILFIGFNISAQSNVVREKWNKSISKNGNLITDCIVIENIKGEPTVFGKVKGKGMYFAVLDRYGDVLYDTSFGTGKEKINAAVAFGENYLVVGQENKKGKSQPALWQLEIVEKKWIQINLDLTSRSGEFKDIILHENGDLFITGNLDNKVCLLRLDKSLKLKGTPIINESGEGSSATSLTATKSGHVFVTGHTNDTLKVWKFDVKGSLMWKKGYDSGISKGMDILVLANGNIVIAGSKKNLVSNENILLLKINEDGHLFWIQTYEDQQKVIANSVIQTPDRQILMGGFIFPWGAKMEDTYLQSVDRLNGEAIEAPVISGSYRADKVNAITSFQNGDYIITYFVTPEGNRKPLTKLVYFQNPNNPCDIELAGNENFFFIKDPNLSMLAEGDYFAFQGNLVSKFPLDEWAIKIKSTNTGIKDIDLPLTLKNQFTYSNQYCYYLEKKLSLNTGTNKIDLEIEKDNQKYEDSYNVFYIPERPNLHILSIGIAAPDLDFTGKDAMDFSTLFKEQEGKLFKKVYIETLHTKEETNASKIASHILQLKDQYLGKSSKGEPIYQEDVLIVFISSHGQLIGSEDEFILPGSNYNRESDKTYIRFKKRHFGCSGSNQMQKTNIHRCL